MSWVSEQDSQEKPKGAGWKYWVPFNDQALLQVDVECPQVSFLIMRGKTPDPEREPCWGIQSNFCCVWKNLVTVFIPKIY